MFGISKRDPAVDPLIKQLFDRCCAHRVPATVLSADTGQCCRGHFIACDDEQVAIALQDRSAELVLLPDSLCCVTFNVDDHAQVFLQSVVDCQTPDGVRGPLLQIAMPETLGAVELRKSTRVAVGDDRNLRVRVKSGEHAVWQARPRDVSAEGISLELEGQADLAVDDQVVIEIERGERATVQRAIVRRRDAQRIGLSFIDAPEVREELRLIVGLSD